ncbi:MAG: hypothetical protein L0Z55_09220 [Planctomycetes bacterium]|nr:hypothetical protein [Planctomycetota bacterium]
MRRFAFFLAVFSVGLMIFLVATGQLGRLFQAGSAARAPTIAEDPFEREPERNALSFNSMDHDLGRLRFELHGYLPEVATLNPKDFSADRTFSDVSIRIPLYDDEPGQPPAVEPTSHFSLQAKEATLDSDQNRLSMTERITCEGADGMRVETTSLVLRWDQDRTNVTIEGDHPVMLEHPQIRLHAEGGIESRLATKTGLGVTMLKPPVVVAVDRRGSFLTLGADQAEVEEGEHLIFVSRKDPLVIDNATKTANFPGHVSMYTAVLADSRGLHPPPPPPATSVDWPGLQLQFDKDMNLRSAQSAAGSAGSAVRVLLSDVNVLEGARWEWTREGTEEWIHFADGVRLTGPHGEFTAREAWVYPVQNRCVLSEEIHARLAGDPERKGSGVRQAVAWMLSADWAELFYDAARKSRGADEQSGLPRELRQVTRFRATSKKVRGVTIVEDFPAGARLSGSAIEFDGDRGILRLTGVPDDRDAAPLFEEGKNRMIAGAMELGLGARRVDFQDGVDGYLHSLPEGVGIEQKEVAARLKDGGSSELHSDRASMTWGEDRRLDAVLAERGSAGTPATFRFTGDGAAVDLAGDKVEWTRAVGAIVASGESGKQALSTETANMFAGVIRYRPAENVAEAEEKVHIRADGISLLPRAKDGAAAQGRADGAAQEFVDVFCERLVAQLRTSAEREALKKERGRSAPLVKSAQAWGNATEGVQITDGAVVAEGERLSFDDDSGLLVLDGKGRQRVFHVADAGRDEMSAQRITILRDERAVELDGDVYCALHQRNHPEWREDEDAPQVPWRIHAGAMKAVFPAEALAARSGDSRAKNKQAALNSAPTHFLARDHVTIDNTELGVHVEGSACEWTGADQRLRVFSESGTGVQTCYYGVAPRDEIVAREISIVYVSGGPRRLNIFFEDVVNATVHSRQEKERNAEIPLEFRMSAKNVLATVEQPEGAAAEGMLREVLAWEDVNFQGGNYRVLAHRCAYEAQASNVTFFGDPPSDPVYAIVDGSRSLQGDPFIIRITETGYEISTKGRYPWDVAGLEEMLELHGAKERRAK